MSASVDPKKIKRIDIFVTKKGEDPKGNKNKAYSLNVNASNYNQKYDFDVYADLVSDKVAKNKVSEFSVQYGNAPPPPPPPPDNIVVSIRYSPEFVTVGDTVNLDGTLTKPTGSNGQITSWDWKARDEGGTLYPVTNSNTPLASFVMPDLNWVYVELNVTDSNGKTGTRTVKILVQQPPPPPPDDIPITILMANPPVAKTDEIVVLDASLSKNCDSFTFSQTSGNSVTLEDTGDPKKKQFTAPDVQTQTNLGFKLVGYNQKSGNTTEANINVMIIPKNQPTHKLVRMVIMGDNDTTSYAEKTMQYSVSVPDTERIIHVGDGPYSTSGTKWVNMMRKYITDTIKYKFKISKGNHDCSSSESNQTQIDIENWLTDLKDPSIPNNKIRDNLWLRSEQIGNVFNIYMDSEDLDVEFADRKQYNWVKEQITKAKQLKAQGLIDWVFVYFHKPFFTLKSSHSPYTSVRFLYKDLFKGIVDIIFHGHNHNTQLWLPMIPNASTANGEGSQLFTWKDKDKRIFDFTKEHGWLTVICGHAGHEWNEINDSGSGVQNVMHYRDSGVFGVVKVDVLGKVTKVIEVDYTGKEYFSYEVSKEGGTPPPPPPPPDDDVDAKFPELLAKGKVGSMFLLDGSLSTGNIKNWNITQIEGQTVQLENVPNMKYSKQFLMPNERLKFTLTVFSDTKSNSDTITVDPVTDLPPPPTGDLLWDSNIHLKTGQQYTISGTHGSQAADGKGVFTAASGSPKVVVDPDGTFHLVCKPGHGRMYGQACNHNSVMKGKIKIETDSVDSCTLRLRTRHNEGGDCPNRFGGMGSTIYQGRDKEYEFDTESCHNNHENGQKKAWTNETSMKVGQWYDFEYYVADSKDKKSIKQKLVVYHPNNVVMTFTGAHNSPKPYYMDENLHKQRSMFWLRMNNASQDGSIAFKDITITKLEAGALD